MVRCLLLAAALAAAAAAAGEWSQVLNGCSCGSAIQTYNLTTAAYCPTSAYPTGCDVTQLVETDCMLSCPGDPRLVLAYRNNSATFITTTAIKCVNGVLTNAAGAKIYNLMRPTCAKKAPCDACSASFEETCPDGFSCKASNLNQFTASDGCERLNCTAGTLKLYDATTKAAIAYSASQLYCATNAKWSNYSLDGGITGGAAISTTFTANCILPSSCETCSEPRVATSLSQLPTTFQTGYSIAVSSQTTAAGSCSLFTCPTGYKLYGFVSNATNVTGLEYTSIGYLQCSALAQWANGYLGYVPSGMLSACLKVEYSCTCEYHLQTCTSSNCDNTLIATRANIGGAACTLGCPTGYRMIVADGENGNYYRMNDVISCNGTEWTGRYWMADYNYTFSLARTWAMCETRPIPENFTWPIHTMNCAKSICHAERLVYKNSVLSCSSERVLIISTDQTNFVNPYALTNISYSGLLWTGYELSTGELRTFPASIFMTCYYGSDIPTSAPTTTTASTTTPAPTTPAPTFAYPCDCQFQYEDCLSGNCNYSVVEALPLAAGESCSLACPDGMRMIIADGEHGNFYRVENFVCNGTAWNGLYWLTNYDVTFSFSSAYVTCETSGFPIGFDWPLDTVVCDKTVCRNERLAYSNGALICVAGTTLTMSEAPTTFVYPYTLSNITWYDSDQVWIGYDLTTGDERTFSYEIYMTCYSGTPPTFVPTTPTSTTPMVTSSGTTDGSDETTPIDVTVAPTPAYPCDCQFQYEDCLGQTNCNYSVVQTLPLSDGEMCSLGCPEGMRMIIADGEHGVFYRVENFLCDGTAWNGLYWLADYDVSFSFANAYVTCEPSGFPIGFDWPLNTVVCEQTVCRNERLRYSNGALRCFSGTILTMSASKTTFVYPYTLSNITWYESDQVWRGYDLTTSEKRTFGSDTYMACYSGTPPTFIPTTAASTTPVLTSAGTTPEDITDSTTEEPTSNESTTEENASVEVTTIEEDVTTPQGCSSYDSFPLNGVSVTCVDGQNRMQPVLANARIIVITASSISYWHQMTFVDGHGWISFNCDGSVRVWSEDDVITSITYEMLA